MGPDGPKWAQEDFFPTNPDLANILGRTDLDFENLYFFVFFGSQISGLGPPWAHLGPAWAHRLGPSMGPPTWAQHGPTPSSKCMHSVLSLGLDLDLRIRPAPAAPAPAASGNPRLGPLGIKVEKQGFRMAWLITGRKF